MTGPHQNDPLFEPALIDPRSQRPALVRWALNDWPYVLMLLLAVAGVSWTTFTDQPATVYWALLAPVFGVISIVAGWPHVAEGKDRLSLIYTQAAHWAAVLAAMLLFTLPDVRGIANDNATGLALLILLALGTFIAGLQARVWQICAVGAFLAIEVPVIAWIDQSALFLSLFALLLVAIGGVFWWLRRR